MADVEKDDLSVHKYAQVVSQRILTLARQLHEIGDRAGSIAALDAACSVVEVGQQLAPDEFPGCFQPGELVAEARAAREILMLCMGVEVEVPEPQFPKQTLMASTLVMTLHPRLMSLLGELRDCGDWAAALGVVEAMTTMYEVLNHMSPEEFRAYEVPADVKTRRRERAGLITLLDHPDTSL